MNDNAVSPVQMLDWRIADFTFSNNVIAPSAEIPHSWTINAHINHMEPSDHHLRASIYVRFVFQAEQSGSKIHFEGTAASYFVFDKEMVETGDPQALFEHVLHGSAMTNMLGNLRVFLLQAGTIFQAGTKRVMLPFINLNEFEFDKDYTYNV